MTGLSFSFSQRRAARWFIVALLIGLISYAIALPFSTKATLQSSDSSGRKLKRQIPQTVPGKILVRYRSEATAEKGERQATVQSEALGQIPLAVERFEGSELVEGLRRVHVAPEQTNEAIAALQARPGVLYAEPVYLVHKDATPNDTRYTDLWALRNFGQSGGLAGADIDAEQAWNVTAGSSSVVVGVIDEGIYINHEDLQANIWTNPGEVANNGVDDDGNGFIDDVNGWDFANNDKTVYDGPTVIGPGVNPAFVVDAHATHVAGTIGAVGNNGKGVAGINWNVKIMSLKFIGSNGLGATDDEIRAFYYAKQMREMWESSGHTKGANLRVLNNSYGGSPFTQATFDGISALNDAGILFVAAAGNTDDGLINNDTDPHYPASYDLPNVISVAATDRTDNLAFFSHYGANTVHIAAPGRDILSTTPVNTYSLNSGTSMATPQVTGAAALLCSAYPNLSVQKLRSLLIYNGDQLPSLSNRVFTGSRLNVFSSLQAAADTTAPGTVGNLRIIAQNGRTITLAWTASGDDGGSGNASLYNIELAEGSKKTALAKVKPVASGVQQTITLNVPYRHKTGIINLREFDNAGNEGAAATVPYAVSATIADPYQASVDSPATLSSGGTPLNLKADDKYSEGFGLPFVFPFFGQNYSSVTISTNGNLYFSAPPKRVNGDADDVPGSTNQLAQYKMIAGMWDDLRTDLRVGDDVYVVTPDAAHIIFRWQGVDFFREQPINFEIELSSDGTIKTRYGDGNQLLLPVVGISGGEPDAYVIDSLTSETIEKSLTNAPSAVFKQLPTVNQIDDTQYFVTQHYLDFLNRQPDQGGLDFWTAQISQNCSPGDLHCILEHRISVSAAFFIELEFQDTGSYVYRFYRGTLGRQPSYGEFTPDRAQVIGGTNLEASKQAFADNWVQRASFKAIYPDSMSNTDFVNTLFNTAGLVPYTAERQAAINQLNSGGTRAQVIRGMIEDAAFKQREYNPAFVMMQYFGYLKRDYDQGGYDFWLNVLNNREPNNYRGMVCSFITSAEYQLRFGSAINYTNQYCQQ